MRILVTAGPTREYFDPVRFLSNPSSGKMGYALAVAAKKMGHKVTLISGPTSLKAPKDVTYHSVVTAHQMYRAVLREAKRSDLIMMAAAVSDYRPSFRTHRKVKKSRTTQKIRLIPNPDILKELGRRKKKNQILVGFAAETHHLIPNALKKLRRKNLDFIVANQIGRKGSGFESSRNKAFLLAHDGRIIRFPLMTKKRLASQILNICSCFTADR